MLARYLFGGQERIVHGGPFEGLKYPSDISFGSELLPILIGSYELDIHEWIHKLCANRYTRVVNIGCGEGYYAVGFARCMPDAEVFAYDISEKARRNCRRLAEANGTEDRVHVREVCTAQELARLGGTGTLIVCDCEGCEYDLLRPDALEVLRRCDVLVELHQSNSPDSEGPENLIDRFRSTHRVARRIFGGRHVADFPLLDRLPRVFRQFAVDENRSRGLSWALLETEETN